MKSTMIPRRIPMASLLLALLLVGSWVVSAPANPLPYGTCCFTDGHCEMADPDVCEAQGGHWIGTESCTPNPCPGLLGACCFPDGSCSVRFQVDCSQGTSVWMGPNTNCNPNPCPPCLLPCGGVCCLPDGHCENITLAQCQGANGTWMDGALSCSPDPCITSGASELKIELKTWGQIKKIYR